MDVYDGEKVHKTAPHGNIADATGLYRCFFHCATWLGCSSYFLHSSDRVCRYCIASKATFAMNSAVNFRRLFLVVLFIFFEFCAKIITLAVGPVFGEHYKFITLVCQHIFRGSTHWSNSSSVISFSSKAASLRERLCSNAYCAIFADWA